MFEQHYLRSSINFVMYNIKPGTLTAGTVKINFKGKTERFIARKNAFSCMNSVKGTPTYLKQVLYIRHSHFIF